MRQQEIAIVTGVSRIKGVGKAICVELAKKGIDVFFTYWTDYDKKMPWKTAENEPEIIEKEITNHGVRCSKLELNLMEDQSIETLLNTVETQLGIPNILVNNATYSTQTSLATISAKEFDCHYNVNLKATILLTAAFAQRFGDNITNGRVVNLSSGQSLSMMNEEIAYAVTKAGIDNFTKTVSQELAAKNITINAVNPGLTDSGWMDDKLKAYFKDRFPMGRIGMPEDAAKLIAFLISDEAKWITGQIIHSEGGFIREKYD